MQGTGSSRSRSEAQPLEVRGLGKNRVPDRPKTSEVLAGTAPFQILSSELLNEIGNLAVHLSFSPGEKIYSRGDAATKIYVVLSGSVEHILGPDLGVTNLMKIVGPGEVFGWAALLKEQPYRLAETRCIEPTEVLCIGAKEMFAILACDPGATKRLMSEFAAIIERDFSVPKWLMQMEQAMPHGEHAEITAIGNAMFQLAEFLRSPRPYLMLVGFGILFGFWYLSVDVWKLPRFREMPGLPDVLHEWTRRDPAFGVSVFTADYYHDIWVSCRRVGISFAIATCLGVPLGLILGWSRKFCAYVFPAFEIFRPIPVIAWVPLAILMFKGTETPVIFLVTMAAFFATTINAMLGVQSIDEAFVRAAACLGANKWQIFRHVVLPGALPFIFTGLQIGMGVAWFSLVVGEMVAGQYGLGYRINSSYVLVAYPTIVIAMATLGFVGYLSSAIIRIIGNALMRWRARELQL